MPDKFPRLTYDGTELILIGNPKMAAKVQHFELTIYKTLVRPSACAKNSVLYFMTLLFSTTSTSNLRPRRLSYTISLHESRPYLA